MTSTDLLHQLEYNYPQGNSLSCSYHKQVYSLIGASAVEVKEISSIYLDYVRTGLMEIRPGLEDRVFVALVRGLWDNVAKELFLFIMELKEDVNNKVRMNFSPSLYSLTYCVLCRHGFIEQIAHF